MRQDRQDNAMQDPDKDESAPARNGTAQTRAGYRRRRHGQPAVNIPAIVLALIAAFVLVHLLRTQILAPEAARQLLIALAFLPLRYALPEGVSPGDLPGGWAAWFLSPVTHMVLHAGWGHLTINSVWLAAFGTPVARRLGAIRFLLLACLSAAGGALVFLATHYGEGAILMGASGAISGLMGAAVRLIYATGDTLLEGVHADLTTVRPLSLADLVRRPGPRTFIIVWLGTNLVFGVWSLGTPGMQGSIAWDAHLGGFVTGLLALPLFDRHHPPQDVATSESRS